MTMAAVVAGNTVVLKPSSDTPILAHRLVEMAHEAGVPEGVINLVPGSGGEIGDYLVTHPDVRFVSFTGSAEVGLRINEIIAKPDPRQRWMTRYVSEMGGKNAIVVDETADLESASIGAVRSAFGFQGQKCSACSRLIVDRRVHGKLVELVLEKAKMIPVGDPWEDPCVFTGPVANAAAHRSILAAIETGKGEGKLLLGGHALDRPGYYIAPTIFDGVKAGSFLEQEEIFGPVLAIIPVDGFDEALAVANDTRYGLTGAVYSDLHRPDRPGEARVPRRQPLPEPRLHRRARRRPPVRRFQPLGDRLEGRRSRLPDELHAGEDDVREDHDRPSRGNRRLKDLLFPWPPRRLAWARPLQVALRTLHIVSMAVVLGGVAWGVPEERFRHSVVLTVVSGVLLLAIDLSRRAASSSTRAPASRRS